MSPQHPAQEIVVMKGSQLGFTEALINIMFYYMVHDPCPILCVEPTIGVAEKFSKQRLAPSIAECPALDGKVADNKSRESGNTTLQKDFPGGTLILGGANSAAALRSMPIRILLEDELDAYPLDCDGEGSPSDLAERRTTNFARRKIIKGGTPTVKETSVTEKSYQESDQRRYYVPCPFCGRFQTIEWSRIKFENRDPSTARMVCENDECKADIYERNKTAMLEKGEWRAHNPESKIVGFHISALYSPLGWYSWKDAVKDHLDSLGDPNKRKVWVNTVLAETFDDSAVTIDPHWLKKRKEVYTSDVPLGALVVTIGGDVQDDRIEMHTVGWGLNGESWVIDYSKIMGDPKKRDVWNQLDSYLKAKWLHESGVEMLPGAVCIDAGGHCTDEVYAFCAARQAQKVFPIFGRKGSGRQLVHRAVKSERAKCYVFYLGVDQAKATFYSRLRTADVGPGYVHFPARLPDTGTGDRELTDGYFEGLTSERRVQRRHGGLPVFDWVLPPGKRNEPLDTMVYAMSALQILNPNLELLASEQNVYTPNPGALVRRQRRILSKGFTA
jgi:phage terminase large subunit GpA-like protein